MDKFDEYKLFVEDTARFTSNRQTANNIYVAVNSIVLSASAFIFKETGFADFWKSFVALPVLIAGVVVCLQWSRLIVKYKELIGFRIRELKKIETEVTNSHKMYEKEVELYPIDAEGKLIPGKGLNFSDRERWLPRTFLSVYLLYIFGLIASFFN